LTAAQEVLCWAALCFSPGGVGVYDPLSANHYKLTHHYHNSGWSVTYGLDLHVQGKDQDWLVVKYDKDVFAPLKKDRREVSHHWPDGSVKWGVE
jgi:hypothetical protein